MCVPREDDNVEDVFVESDYNLGFNKGFICALDRRGSSALHAKGTQELECHCHLVLMRGAEHVGLELTEFIEDGLGGEFADNLFEDAVGVRGERLGSPVVDPRPASHRDGSRRKQERPVVKEVRVFCTELLGERPMGTPVPSTWGRDGRKDGLCVVKGSFDEVVDVEGSRVLKVFECPEARQSGRCILLRSKHGP